MMFEYLPIESFKAIYVVDLCHSLCEVAKRKVLERGWKNVHVVESDACTFTPPGGAASLVTFSYSLSSECAGLCMCGWGGWARMLVCACLCPHESIAAKGGVGWGTNPRPLDPDYPG